MPEGASLFACEISKVSDEELESHPIPALPAQFFEWIMNKRRVRDRWASIVARLLLLEALRSVGARTLQLHDLARGVNYSPLIPPSFCGSVSHTADVVVAVAACGGSLGIDIESNKLVAVHSDQIRASFSEREKLELAQHGDPVILCRLWTRKEALAKATGRARVQRETRSGTGARCRARHC